MVLSLLVSAAIASAAPKNDPCKGSTTPEVNACLGSSLDRSKARLKKYLQTAFSRYGDDNNAAVRLGIQASQDAFETYRSIECATVSENWKGGTIGGAMNLACETALTDERTHDIWAHWLQYMDSTPPILPEPKPTK
ncbi:MAG: lysozyme inhibitor LprI family protein [Sphingomicrobium sp.]